MTQRLANQHIETLPHYSVMTIIAMRRRRGFEQPKGASPG